MSRPKWTAVAGILCVLGGGSSAFAQSNPSMRNAENRADVQCMSVAAVAAGSVEEGSVAQWGLVATMNYFLGRLETRAPEVDWLAQMGAYLKGDVESEMKAQSERCGAEIVDLGGRLTSWAENFKAGAPKSAETSKEALGGPDSPAKP